MIQQVTPRVPNDHLAQKIAREHDALLDAADELVRVAAHSQRARDPWPLMDELRAVARRFSTAESFLDLEERVLYPRLELRGIVEVPHAARLEHDAIRLEVKALRELAATPGEPQRFRRELRRIRNTLVPIIRDHVRREDGALLPLALEVIGEDAWSLMKLEHDALAGSEDAQ